jgi:hypothetical protein
MEGILTFPLLKELIMERTFLDVLSHFKHQDDKPSIEFVRYVMLKYFDEKRIFMLVEEAIPFLEEKDREEFITLVNGVSGIQIISQ